MSCTFLHLSLVLFLFLNRQSDLLDSVPPTQTMSHLPVPFVTFSIRVVLPRTDERRSVWKIRKDVVMDSTVAERRNQIVQNPLTENLRARLWVKCTPRCSRSPFTYEQLPCTQGCHAHIHTHMHTLNHISLTSLKIMIQFFFLFSVISIGNFFPSSDCSVGSSGSSSPSLLS